jgi:hypothetical protein
MQLSLGHVSGFSQALIHPLLEWEPNANATSFSDEMRKEAYAPSLQNA